MSAIDFTNLIKLPADEQTNKCKKDEVNWPAGSSVRRNALVGSLTANLSIGDTVLR